MDCTARPRPISILYNTMYTMAWVSGHGCQVRGVRSGGSGQGGQGTGVRSTVSVHAIHFTSVRTRGYESKTVFFKPY